MNIGFLVNQIDYRGTGNALFDYAHYNEEILGNKSHILTMLGGDHDSEQMARFSKRFDKKFGYIDYGIPKDLDAIYHIKYGGNDIDLSSILPYWVHAVFDGSQPHGSRYAVISPWMSAVYGQSYVPHIVHLPRWTLAVRQANRERLNIPKSATVIGRIGASNTFDISFVWNAILESLIYRSDLYFLFIGPVDGMPVHDRIIAVEQTIDPEIKSGYIAACDAMIHARRRGETFGLACAEFVHHGRPVITYRNSPEKAHLLELENQPPLFFYTDQGSALEALLTIMSTNKRVYSRGYNYNPHSVMYFFKEVFIDGKDHKYTRSEPRITL